MASATAVAVRIAYRCRDGSQTELGAAGYLAFLNDALADLAAAGWLAELEEDESIPLAADTYRYDVPANFVYILDVYVEGASGIYDTPVPRWQWRLGYDGSKAAIFFDSRWFTIVAAKKLKFVGQKRQPAFTGAETVPPAMENFLRERGVAYAAAHLVEGVSDNAAARSRISELAWQASELILSHQPVEHRAYPGSRQVPGR